MRIKSVHIFQEKKVNSIEKLLATINNIFYLMNKKYYYEKTKEEYLYFYFDKNNNVFYSHENKSEYMISILNKIGNKKRFYNSNKVFAFKKKEDKFLYYGLYYLNRKELVFYDNSEELNREVKELSKDIVIKTKRKIEIYYKTLYNDFLKQLKEQNIVLKIDNVIRTIKIKDIFYNKKINKNKKILYKNKKYSYNSIKLYVMIVENKNNISLSIFEKIKYDLLSIFICKFLCDFLNCVNKKNVEYNIFDNENKIYYKIVKDFNIDYNNLYKDKELMPPLLPTRI